MRSAPSPLYPRDVFGNTLPMAGIGSPTRADSGPEAVWTVGGTVVTEGVASTTDGRGGRVTSGTSAPHYTVDFIRRNTPSEQEAQHGQRLAAAMEVSTDDRMLPHSSPVSSPSRNNSQRSPIGVDGTRRTFWSNSAWEKDIMTSPTRSVKPKIKDVPVIPFRVLDAPALRDDYYCSLLAYSPTLQCLAVGLGPHVYLWSEHRDTAPIPEPLTAPFDAHVTSLSFSSNEGGSAILAIGRADGRMNLWSPKDPGDPRFDIKQPSPISCVSFRPTTVKRRSIREPSEIVPTEELLIGDETGNVYMYAIEWPSQDRRDLFDWHGSMTMLAKFTCHTQQVCGIAWSRSGCTFATGGNDNALFVYDSKKLFTRCKDTPASNVTVRNGNASESDSIAGQGEILAITPGRESKLFNINAACKAIAFAPWQSSLIAARGGSNDRCIHFYHAQSGATLATIDCLAQVTSLTWSETRSEIAATFGFAQPEHPFRVAVFSWPSCQEIVKIPWIGEERALYAIAYPGGPSTGPTDKKKGKSELEMGYGRRTREEGCLVIATSDASIKFHEIWPEGSKKSKRISGGGLLGGSQILEDGISEELERKSAIR
ncbi:unnamed protein product [Zymoseptoria tritici ST99CH_3D7]|uniref:Anaphase-promoting complex subunit 4 WD40 domain-containing protein n=2 Tax=Zymoseptoria tritici TaxID=1047171 RepID=A0A1X7RQG8_ZYMT9|nr:unnamed protein product [Zymoseptoria tritici ST99CH_3D7]SMR50625.1 unnamed protein product [Zymoseptoria tritici ST99CH_1E4]